MNEEQNGIGTKAFLVILYTPFYLAVALEIGRAKGWW